MKEFITKNLSSMLIGLATVVLGGVAIFTAYRLYQLRTEPVAPTAPQSFPQAEEENIVSCQQLTFSIQETPTPTGTLTPSLTPTATQTPTFTPTPTGTLNPTQTPTNTPVPTGTDTPQGATSTPTSTPTTGQLAQATPTDTTSTLPDAGSSIPSIIMLTLGALLLLITYALVI